uniref:Uncharacterized protein n=1 Tax=Rhizophora mucronata TaxID=61149 RepID=A0A2P2NMC2_RHIMU
MSWQCKLNNCSHPLQYIREQSTHSSCYIKPLKYAQLPNHNAWVNTLD